MMLRRRKADPWAARASRWLRHGLRVARWTRAADPARAHEGAADNDLICEHREALGLDGHVGDRDAALREARAWDAQRRALEEVE